MERKQFSTTINASREKVWDILWNDETYPVWTSAFSEGSKAVTDWKKGSKVLFLNDKNEGMVSEVADRRDNEFMSFRHLGVVKDGVEDTTSPEVQQWAGGTENYTLKDVGEKTELLVDMDLSEEWQDYFNETWPKALAKLKELAE